MGKTIDRYYASLGEFNSAVTGGRYRVALRHLRDGLDVSIKAIDQMKDDFQFGISTPFASTKAGAIAALFADEVAFSAMDEFARHFKLDDDSTPFRADARAMVLVRESLKTDPSQKLEDLKAQVEPQVAARLLRLLRWMEKNSELSIEPAGKSHVVTGGAPTLIPAVVLETFRSGENVVQVDRKPIREIARGYLEDGEDEPDDGDSDGEPDIDTLSLQHPTQIGKLPTESRHPGVMKTEVFKDGYWLIGTSRSKAGGRHTTPVNVLNSDGESIKKFDLDFRLIRQTTTRFRSQIVLLDSLLNVHVYSFDGTPLRSFGLLKNPEFNSVYSHVADYMKASVVLRGLDVSPESGEVIFTIFNRIWRFTTEGTLVSATKLAYEYTYTDSDEMSEFAALMRQETESSRDQLAVISNELAIPGALENPDEGGWIYYAQFSDLDDSVYVCVNWGDVVKISRDGEYDQHWVVDECVLKVIELSDRLLLTGYFDGVIEVAPDGSMRNAAMAGEVIFHERYAINAWKREVQIVDMTTEELRSFSVPGDIKAVYPRGDNLRIDMTTSFAEISFA